MKKVTAVVGFIAIIAVVLMMRFLTSRTDDAGVKSKISGEVGRNGGATVVAVQAVDVTYGHMQQNKEFTGSIKAAYSYIVAAKISGRLVSLSKRIGDKVGLNSAVGKIDDTEYYQEFQKSEAEVAVSKASVQEAEAQVIYAEREMKRIKELVSKGVSSQAELDVVETQHATQKSRLDLAKAQLAQREAAMAQAQTRLTYTTIRSAQAGYIATRHTDGGALLSVNSPVLTIVGIDTVYVEISVPERDYPLIVKGQKAFISVEALPERKFEGRVSSASPLFQTSTRTAAVEIAVVNDSLLLKPGMFARINLTLAERDSAQIVPVTAVVNRNGTDAVFIAGEDMVAKLVPITTGFRNGDNIEVIKPELAGKVITFGNHLLTHGTKISFGSNTQNRIDDTKKADVNGNTGASMKKNKKRIMVTKRLENE